MKNIRRIRAVLALAALSLLPGASSLADCQSGFPLIAKEIRVRVCLLIQKTILRSGCFDRHRGTEATTKICDEASAKIMSPADRPAQHAALTFS